MDCKGRVQVHEVTGTNATQRVAEVPRYQGSAGKKLRASDQLSSREVRNRRAAVGNVEFSRQIRAIYPVEAISIQIEKTQGSRFKVEPAGAHTSPFVIRITISAYPAKASKKAFRIVPDHTVRLHERNVIIA